MVIRRGEQQKPNFYKLGLKKAKIPEVGLLAFAKTMTNCLS